MSLNHTFATLCIIRSSRSKNDKVPIYLRITVDGKRAEISTKEYVAIDKWSREKGRMKGNSEDARKLNKRLDTRETKAKEYHNEFLRDDRVPTGSNSHESSCWWGYREFRNGGDRVQ